MFTIKKLKREGVYKGVQGHPIESGTKNSPLATPVAPGAPGAAGAFCAWAERALIVRPSEAISKILFWFIPYRFR